MQAPAGSEQAGLDWALRPGKLVLHVSLPPALRCHLGRLCALEGGGSPPSPRTAIVGRRFLLPSNRQRLQARAVFYVVTWSSPSLGGSDPFQACVVTGKPSFMPDGGLCGGLIPGPLS